MKKQNDQSGFTIIEVGLIVLVVGLVGLVGWRAYDANFNKPQQNNSLTEEVSTEQELLSADLVELAELPVITEAAVQDKPGVTVVHIELEQGEGGLFYKAQLSDGTVVVFNARTGALVKTLQNTELSDEVLPVAFDAGIGFAKALEIAKAEKPNSKAFKIELELEDGVVVYSVRFTDKARVDVDAKTGAIVRTKAARPIIPEDQNGDNNASHSVRHDEEHRADDSVNSGSGSSNSGRDDSTDDEPSTDDLSDNDDDDDHDDHDDDEPDDSDDDSSSNSGSGSSDSGSGSRN